MGATMLPCNEYVKSEDETAIELWIGLIVSTCACQTLSNHCKYNQQCKLEKKGKKNKKHEAITIKFNEVVAITKHWLSRNLTRP